MEAEDSKGRYGDLRQFFRWAVEDAEITNSPMTNVRSPTVPETPVPIVAVGDLMKLPKAREGKEFEKNGTWPSGSLSTVWCASRRSDRAFRRGCGLRHPGDPGNGKGRRPCTVPFGAKTGQAVERSMRLRKAHAFASAPNLWLGPRGPMTDSRIAQILRRRCGCMHLTTARSAQRR